MKNRLWQTGKWRNIVFPQILAVATFDFRLPQLIYYLFDKIQQKAIVKSN